jgi:hypothetical protein
MAKITIAEENILVGINLKRILEKEGHEVTRRNNLDGDKDSCDVIIISQNMDYGGKSGESYDDCLIPVVYLTTSNSIGKFKEITPFAKAYIPKPIDNVELRQTIKDVLSQ